MIIVLTGIDGSGKTTAARTLADSIRANGQKALLQSNYAGRRVLSVWSDRTGIRLPLRLLDAIETSIRILNVLLSHLQASRFDGQVVMDRHLHCQLALREVKGLRRGWLLPWLLRVLPAPDLIVHLDVDPRTAYQRIIARGTDKESLTDLAALAAAYRRLPEFPAFTVIDANRSADDVGRRLFELIAGAQIQAV